MRGKRRRKILDLFSGAWWGYVTVPTGATGAAGATILDSYESLAALTAAHPTGTVGDAYLAGGELYVWDGTQWQSMGRLVGPTGATGAAGATILDSYDTLAELTDAHPTGTVGDAYLAGGVLYVWDGTEWKSMGSLVGPTGASVAAAIIPFASQQAPLVRTNPIGESTDVALIGFGYMDYYNGLALADVAIEIDPNDGSFNLTSENNRQLVFSLPFDMTINSIYATVGNFGTFAAFTAGAMVYPYVQLYAAVADANTFMPIEGAIAKPEVGINPAGAAAATMRSASVTGLDIRLPAGTRIAIGGLMEITGENTARDYWLYFTGGIGMTQTIE